MRFAVRFCRFLSVILLLPLVPVFSQNAAGKAAPGFSIDNIDKSIPAWTSTNTPVVIG
jgi:hypothetical protein